MTTTTILCGLAFMATAVAIRSAAECRRLRLHVRTLRQEYADGTQIYRIYTHAVAAFEPVEPYEIEQVGYTFAVVRWHREEDEYPVRVVARVYHFRDTDPDDKAYALRCAEELRDKLNEPV